MQNNKAIDGDRLSGGRATGSSSVSLRGLMRDPRRIAARRYRARGERETQQK